MKSTGVLNISTCRRRVWETDPCTRRKLWLDAQEDGSARRMGRRGGGTHFDQLHHGAAHKEDGGQHEKDDGTVEQAELPNGLVLARGEIDAANKAPAGTA